jgi:hypothetical protein
MRECDSLADGKVPLLDFDQDAIGAAMTNRSISSSSDSVIANPLWRFLGVTDCTLVHASHRSAFQFMEQ